MPELKGAMKAGPSEDYKALLRGEITSEEYVHRLKADVDRRLSVPVRQVRASIDAEAAKSAALLVFVFAVWSGGLFLSYWLGLLIQGNAMGTAAVFGYLFASIGVVAYLEMRDA